MLNDVIEAECQIAYAQEGERLKRASAAMLAKRQANLSRRSFPILKDYAPTAKPFYRKVGGLHFLSFGPFRISFCIVSNNGAKL